MVGELVEAVVVGFWGVGEAAVFAEGDVAVFGGADEGWGEAGAVFVVGEDLDVEGGVLKGVGFVVVGLRGGLGAADVEVAEGELAVGVAEADEVEDEVCGGADGDVAEVNLVAAAAVWVLRDGDAGA